MSQQKLKKYLKNLPKYLKKPKKTQNYGTSGYRTKEYELDPIIARCAIVSYIRSSTFCGKYIGIMITASHNPESDNGVKLIDNNGDMFDSQWENICDSVVNCEDDDLYSLLSKIHRRVGNQIELGAGIKGKILVGRDTRSSGERFYNVITEVLMNFDCIVVDLGIVSTPQMHFLVRNANLTGKLDPNLYFEHLGKCFEEIGGKFNENLLIDTANGVPKLIFEKLKKYINCEKLEVWNKETGILNYECGADFVKSNFKPPINYNINDERRCVSFDGDMDRLIYFKTQPEFKIIDGDNICALFAMFFTKKVENKLNVGCVLSDYSNLAAIKFIKNICPVSIATTGIKNFVKSAKKYDIGIFFEPNGHGGIVFSQNARNYLDSINLSGLYKIFDPSIGDPLADLLVLETLIPNINEKLYIPTPMRIINVHTKEYVQIILNENKKVIKPQKLATAIEELNGKYHGIVFIRPSGTEKLVRIFVQSEKKDDCDILCINAAQAVYDICGGIGPHPEISYYDN